MIGLALIALSGLLAWRARRLAESWQRAAVQGATVIGAVAGIILVLRRPGSAWQWPGYRPRQWYQP